VLDLNSFIIHHMSDEFRKNKTCKSHITLVQLLNFILYHLCNFPIFVSMLNLSEIFNTGSLCSIGILFIAYV